MVDVEEKDQGVGRGQVKGREYTYPKRFTTSYPLRTGIGREDTPSEEVIF